MARTEAHDKQQQHQQKLFNFKLFRASWVVDVTIDFQTHSNAARRDENHF